MAEEQNARRERIVTALQAEIRRHQFVTTPGHAPEHEDYLARVRQTQWVNPHLPIGWPVMPKGLFNKLRAYGQKIVRRLLRWYINPLVEQQNRFNASVVDAFQNLQRRMEEHDWEVLSKHQEIDHTAEQQRFSRQLNDVSEYLQNMVQQIELQETQQTSYVEQLQAQFKEQAQVTQQVIEPLRLRVQRLEQRQASAAYASLSVAPKTTETPSTEPVVDTFILGIQYRNDALMSERLSDYDDILKQVMGAEGSRDCLPLLDIGCGRGEFVAHVKQLGIRAYGIDLDADAVAWGVKEGLDLRLEDAFAHLGALADNSLQAVTAVQVIEHLSYQELAHLFKLAAQKLCPGGVIITETINPVCLWALSNHYLLDPTHKMPVHPLMAKFILEQAGFWQVQIRYLHPVPDEERLGWVHPNPETACLNTNDRILQANIDRLNAFLYGPQDYAAVAYKPEE